VRYRGWHWADPACSLCISFLLTASAVPLVRRNAAAILLAAPAEMVLGIGSGELAREIRGEVERRLGWGLGGGENDSCGHVGGISLDPFRSVHLPQDLLEITPDWVEITPAQSRSVKTPPDGVDVEVADLRIWAHTGTRRAGLACLVLRPSSRGAHACRPVAKAGEMVGGEEVAREGRAAGAGDVVGIASAVGGGAGPLANTRRGTWAVATATQAAAAVLRRHGVPQAYVQVTLEGDWGSDS
jgi:hypothetical protein